MIGTTRVDTWNTITALIYDRKVDPVFFSILFKIRLPRILLAGLVGMVLSMAGVVFQALLRNPLAEPFVLGISSGAAIGAVLAIIFGIGYGIFLPTTAFLGALVSMALVFSLARRQTRMSSTTVILIGVVVSAFFSSLIMFFIAITSDHRLSAILFWLYGDLSLSTYEQVGILAPVAILGGIFLFGYSRSMNIINTGEDVAKQLGVEVERVKLVLFGVSSLITAVAVAESGVIGFVGLIVPHLMRMAFGPDHRLLLPTSGLFGASFMIAADTAARTVVSPNELPVGVITAFLGAPFFIMLLRTRGSRWG